MHNMKVINREDITDDTYREILDVETHHDHEIVIGECGNYRWKKHPEVRKMVDDIGLNELWNLFTSLGYGKNSEIFRKMYRDMGVSLFGYWEIFYWEMNKEKSQEYIDERFILNRDKKIDTVLN